MPLEDLLVVFSHVYVDGIVQGAYDVQKLLAYICDGYSSGVQ